MKSYFKLDVSAVNVCAIGNNVLAMLQSSGVSKLCLSLVDTLRRTTPKVATFQGSRSLLLSGSKGRVFIGVDNKLLVSDDMDSWKVVLDTKNRSNLFWHMDSSKGGTIYVQEYGEPPTGIFVSEDGYEWRLLITAQDIDKKAKHFHSISCDPYRDMVVATLGDRNYVRIAASYDGESWKPVYRSAWQVLPIVVLKDRIVFGMDSGIAKGGLVIWKPDREEWQVLHLKRTDGGKFMQMSDLRLLRNGVWVAALGAPQAIIASVNLKEWYLLHFEGPDETFNHSMGMTEGEDLIAFSTGKSLVVADKNEIANEVGKSLVAAEHTPSYETLIGLGFCVKRRIGL